MSIEKNRSLVAALTVLAFAACGVEANSPVVEEARGEAPLTPAVEAPVAQLASEDGVARLRVAQSPQLAQLQRPARDVVVAHSLPVADGTQVHFMLGIVSCGILVVASGTATVVGGSFEIPYDRANVWEGMEGASLYYRLGDEACDEANPNVFEAAAPLPGTVDLSSQQVTYGGCWLFDQP